MFANRCVRVMMYFVLPQCLKIKGPCCYIYPLSLYIYIYIYILLYIYIYIYNIPRILKSSSNGSGPLYDAFNTTEQDVGNYIQADPLNPKP